MIWFGPEDRVVRRVWLAPGSYEVEIAGAGRPAAELDEQPVGSGHSEAVLGRGHLHTLELSFPGSGVLRSIAIRPSGEGAQAPVRSTPAVTVGPLPVG
jgi:hypothetical protein